MKLNGDEIMLAADFDTYAQAARHCTEASNTLDDAQVRLEHELSCIEHFISLNPKLFAAVEGLKQSPNLLDRTLGSHLSRENRGKPASAPILSPATQQPQCHTARPQGWISRIIVGMKNRLSFATAGRSQDADFQDASTQTICPAAAPTQSGGINSITIAAEASRKLNALPCKAAITEYLKAKKMAAESEVMYELVALQSKKQGQQIDQSIQVAFNALNDTIVNAPVGHDLAWAREVVQNIENLESAKAEVDAERGAAIDLLIKTRFAVGKIEVLRGESSTRPVAAGQGADLPAIQSPSSFTMK